MNIFILDFMSFFFRAYYVYEQNPQTDIIGLIKGMIRKTIYQFKIENLIISDDYTGNENFRNLIYPDYKKDRGEKDEEVIRVLTYIKDEIKKDYFFLSLKGYESDDIIGTIVRNYKDKENIKLIVISSDKDLLQLVDKNVFMLDTRRKDGNKDYTVYTIDKVKEKYGFGPEHIIDYYTLLGDKSDNIPGVYGIGEKKAKELIELYGSVDNIYENINNIKGSIKKKLEDGVEKAILSKQLFELAQIKDLQTFTYEDIKLKL